MYYIEKWLAKDGWRWRLYHQNGNIMAESGEGYASEQGCNIALRTVRQQMASAVVWRPGDPGKRAVDPAFGYGGAYA